MSIFLKGIVWLSIAFPFFEEGNTGAKHEYFIVVTSKLEDAGELAVLQACEKLIGDTAAVGDSITILVAPKYKRLLSLTVPNGSRNGRLRNPEVEDALDYLDMFFLEETGGQITADGEENKIPEIDAAQLNLPALLAGIQANRLGAKQKLPLRIILVGDPVYDDPNEAGWSMKGGIVIEDGALDRVEAKCPFGKCDDFLPDTTVSIVTPSTIYGQDLDHTNALTRFHWLFFSEKHSELLYCGPNADVAFTIFSSSFPANTVSGKPFEKDPRARKAVRLVSRPSVRKPPDPKDLVPIIIPIRLPPKVNFITEVPVNIDALIAEAEANPEKLLLAIHWETEDVVDIDMWLTNNRFPAQELCWNDVITTFGELHRDVRRSQGSEKLAENWEVATLSCPPEDLTLWLNCYVGAVGAKRIKIVKVFGGIKTEGYINFPGGGDKAEGYLNRKDSESWRKQRIVPKP